MANASKSSRRVKQHRLLLSCATMAIAAAAMTPQRVRAQAFQGSPTTINSTITYDRGGETVGRFVGGQGQPRLAGDHRVLVLAEVFLDAGQGAAEGGGRAADDAGDGLHRVPGAFGLDPDTVKRIFLPGQDFFFC